MGNQTNTPHNNQGNDQKQSKQQPRDDQMSRRGGNMGKDPTGKDQKSRDDQSANRSGSDRNQGR